MEPQDQIECWLRLERKKYCFSDVGRLGCLLCSRLSDIIYIHTTDPKLCRCEAPYHPSCWHGLGFSSVMWPTCEECFLKWFDLHSVKEEKENDRFKYVMYSAHNTIVSNSLLRKHRNSKRALQ